VSWRPCFLGALAALLLAAGSCGRRSSPGADGADVPAQRTTPEARPVYKAPADGKLTRPQVEAYVAVLERVKRDEARTGASGPLAPGDPLDLVPPDLATAKARGLNVAEYAWVKERVLEAEAAMLNEKLLASHLGLLEKTLADLKARRAAAPDEGTRRLLAEQVAGFEAEAARTRRESREREPEAVRANMKAIEPFRARLEAAGDVLDHPLPVARRPSPAPATSGK